MGVSLTRQKTLRCTDEHGTALAGTKNVNHGGSMRKVGAANVSQTVTHIYPTSCLRLVASLHIVLDCSPLGARFGSGEFCAVRTTQKMPHTATYCFFSS